MLPAAPVTTSRAAILQARHELADDELIHLEEFAFQNATVPESYDIAISDGHVFKTPCGHGMASVLVDGRFWHIAGGLLALESAKQELVNRLVEVSVKANKAVILYNVLEEDARRFEAAGWLVNKFGEEPLLDLKQPLWSGKPFEWVRRQANFCVRAGVAVREVCNFDEQQAVATDLLQIMQDDLAGRTFDTPLRLLEGQFDPRNLKRRRLFIAQNSDGLVEAFLAASPIQGGQTWAFETYRKRLDATRGVTPYLFKKVADQLQAEGVQQVSLCLVPGRNIKDTCIKPGDWMLEKTLSFWYHRMGAIFNVQGQDHFKSRFRPTYQNRFICASHMASARSVWSFLKTTGAAKANLRNMWQQHRKQKRGAERSGGQ